MKKGQYALSLLLLLPILFIPLSQTNFYVQASSSLSFTTNPSPPACGHAFTVIVNGNATAGHVGQFSILNGSLHPVFVSTPSVFNATGYFNSTVPAPFWNQTSVIGSSSLFLGITDLTASMSSVLPFPFSACPPPPITITKIITTTSTVTSTLGGNTSATLTLTTTSLFTISSTTFGILTIYTSTSYATQTSYVFTATSYGTTTSLFPIATVTSYGTFTSTVNTQTDYVNVTTLGTQTSGVTVTVQAGTVTSGVTTIPTTVVATVTNSTVAVVQTITGTITSTNTVTTNSTVGPPAPVANAGWYVLAGFSALGVGGVIAWRMGWLEGVELPERLTRLFRRKRPPEEELEEPEQFETVEESKPEETEPAAS